MTLENKKFIKQVIDMNIPFVLVSDYYDESPVNSVLVDNSNGARMIVEYLIKKGHKKIGFIMEDPGMRVEKERFNGYITALKNNGIEYSEDFVVVGTGGYEPMKNMIRKENRPTAVFVTRDENAAAAVNAVTESGLKVPDDISVVGFDNTVFARTVKPELTTVNVPMEQIGKTAVRRLMEIIENKDRGYENIIIPSTIIERDSVKEIN
jgi:DNA-binding LacI/PurR family transcriptional regulator